MNQKKTLFNISHGESTKSVHNVTVSKHQVNHFLITTNSETKFHLKLISNLIFQSISKLKFFKTSTLLFLYLVTKV